MEGISQEELKEFREFQRLKKNINIDDIENLDYENTKILHNINNVLTEGGKVIISKSINDFEKDRRHFIKMYIDNMDEIINQMTSINEIKILYYLFKRIDLKTGLIQVPQYEIVEKLNISKANVSKGIKGLLTKEYILIDENSNKRKQKNYKLNPKFFRYGRIEKDK